MRFYITVNVLQANRRDVTKYLLLLLRKNTTTKILQSMAKQFSENIISHIGILSSLPQESDLKKSLRTNHKTIMYYPY